MTIRLHFSARAAVAALSTALAVGLSGCSVPGLGSVPLPAPTVSGGSYTLTGYFENALNLPEKAKVRLAGADIGNVVTMRARDYTAVVTLRIRDDVRLPVGSTAELRTATPLGDIFVAVKPPANPGTDFLTDGDSLGLDSTSAAATVEDVLGSAAVLVNGGVIRDMTKLVNNLGKTAAGNGDIFGDLIRQSTTLMDTVGGRSEEFQNTLEATTELVDTVNTRQQTIDALLAATAPGLAAIDTDRITEFTEVAGQMAGQLSRFPSMQGTDTRSTVADFNVISNALNDSVTTPDTSMAAVNRLFPMVVKITSGTAIPVDVNLAKLALGNYPDIGYPGDPEFHGPKWADWHYMVGSLRYALDRLHERILGQRP